MMEIVSISKPAKIVFIAVILVIVAIIIVKVLVKTCPDSCDDFNICTEDICSSKTDHECQHKTIEGPVTGCSSNIENCKQKGCSKGECTNIFVENCCGNNMCETDEDIDSCANDCLASLTNHFNSANKGPPDVAYWNTRGFRVIFDKIVVQNEKNDCVLKFKTSEADVNIDINGNSGTVKANSGWNEYKFSCKALKGTSDVVTVTSNSEIQAYFEQVDLKDNHLDQYSVDGSKWIDHQYDLAVDIYEIRYLLW